MMFRYTTPKFIQRLFPSLIWELPNDANKIYLTFDDGPHPRITQAVLDILNKYHAKATFFCVGDNVRKHPDMIAKIESAGHTIGNHTFHHTKGWGVNTIDYVQDVKACQEWVSSNLFRPPYGRITPAQIQALKSEYKIIMWSILTCDYDPNLATREAFHFCTKKMKSGSIIVMHDSVKAEGNMLELLPMLLEYGTEKGFTFDAITS